MRSSRVVRPEPAVKIYCAAIRSDGTIHSSLPPARHCDIKQLMLQSGVREEDIKRAEQGYMTSIGTFIDRFTALRIAVRADQIIRHPIHHDLGLQTDNLW